MQAGAGISLWVRKASTLKKAHESFIKLSWCPTKLLLYYKIKSFLRKSTSPCQQTEFSGSVVDRLRETCTSVAHNAHFIVGTSAHAMSSSFHLLAATILDYVFCLDFPVVTALCTLKFAHFRLLLFIDDFTTISFRICHHFLDSTRQFLSVLLQLIDFSFPLFVALFPCSFHCLSIS